ncbi:hypothetical protein [Nonomuraea terrae]|nr:hypothetical protein [Nonomuraea terrae]
MAESVTGAPAKAIREPAQEGLTHIGFPKGNAVHDYTGERRLRESAVTVA